MSEQKKVIINLIKRIGSNFLQGKSIMNISMPVTVFEGKSFLQRMARSFGHAPLYFRKAAESKNVIEQIKYSACFILSSFTMHFM